MDTETPRRGLARVLAVVEPHSRSTEPLDALDRGQHQVVRVSDRHRRPSNENPTPLGLAGFVHTASGPVGLEVLRVLFQTDRRFPGDALHRVGGALGIAGLEGTQDRQQELGVVRR